MWGGAGTIYAIATQGGQESSILVKEAVPSDALEQGEHMVPVGFREITTTMDVYAKAPCHPSLSRALEDRKVQGAGCRALESALDASGASSQALVRDGLLRSLSLAHQRFPESRSVALRVCRVIGKVALQEPQLVKPEAGGPGARPRATAGGHHVPLLWCLSAPGRRSRGGLSGGDLRPGARAAKPLRRSQQLERHPSRGLGRRQM